MRDVFAEGIKCGKDCSLMCSRTQTVRQFERITYTCLLRITHRLLCFHGWTDKVYIKADMGERRKTLNIWLKRTRHRGGVEGARLEAKDTKKYPRPKKALSRKDPF